MRFLVRGEVPRVALLFVLTFAVLGMHHLAAAPSDQLGGAVPAVGDAAAGSATNAHLAADPGDDAEHGHGFLHLCLAILTVTGGLVLLARHVLFAFRPVGEAAPFGPPHTGAQRDRYRPSPSGRTVLVRVCILRI